MSKNILVISSSLRGGSNSEILADEFIRGAACAAKKLIFALAVWHASKAAAAC